MASKKVQQGQSLFDQRPDIALQWHPTLNASLSPLEVSTGSHFKAWWKCPNGDDHVWQSPVQSRAKQGQGCPFCSGRRASSTNNLLAWCKANGEFGETLIKQFASDLNLDAMDKLTFGSHAGIWWRCQDCQNSFSSPVNRRTSMRTGCPFCSGHRVSTTNSLEALRPELMSEWDFEKNGALSPSDVTVGSNQKVWWKCRQILEHVWEMPIVSRTGQNQGCPFCANRRVDSLNSLQSKSPVLASYFDVEKNRISPSEVLATSHRSYWWRCPHGPDHTWRASPLTVSAKSEPCPCCPPRMTQVSVTNSLRWWCSLNSERGKKVLTEWDVAANSGLTPDEVIYTNQRTKVSWKCPEAFDHVWKTSVHERTMDGRDCPFCNRRRPSSTNNLLDKYPEIAVLLHPTLNTNVDLSTVSPTSHVKLWWKCPNGDDHVWQGTPNSMGGHPQCGFCDGKRVSITNSLASRFPEIAEEFDLEKNKPLTASDVTFGSGKKYWWRCPVNPEHSWSTTASLRTGRLKTGCPECVIAPRSRREILLAHEIGTFFDIDQLDHRVRENGKTFDCDIIIRSERIIIEYDGSYWHKNKLDLDTNKTQSLVDSGWKVIRVREEPLLSIQNHDVLCSEYEPVVGVAARVVRTISSLIGKSIPELQEYESALISKGQEDAERFIQELLNSPDALTAYRQRQSWERYFHQLEEFKAKTGSSDPATIPESKRKLITWVRRQRSLYQSQTLPIDLVLRLESFEDWHWSEIDFRWWKQYESLKDKLESGSQLGAISLGQSLASWTVHQRKLFGLNQLNEEQTELLSGLPNWSWAPDEESWHKNYEALLLYVSRTGNSLVPQDHKEGLLALGVWVNKQRGRFRKLTLEEDRIRLLESIPDWTWNPTISKQEAMFIALDEFLSREGHANVPTSHLENGVRLGQWVNGVRTRFRRGVLDPYLEKYLSSISTFSWEPLEEIPFKNVEILEEFLLANPGKRSVGDTVFKERKLKSIVIYLRRNYSNKSLPQEIIERLEALSNWSWSPHDDSWSIGYSHLLKFVAREGTALVPQKHVENEFKLGIWVNARRVANRKGSLNEHQKEALGALPQWSWNPPRGPQPKQTARSD